MESVINIAYIIKVFEGVVSVAMPTETCNEVVECDCVRTDFS